MGACPTPPSPFRLTTDLFFDVMRFKKCDSAKISNEPFSLIVNKNVFRKNNHAVKGLCETMTNFTTKFPVFLVFVPSCQEYFVDFYFNIIMKGQH